MAGKRWPWKRILAAAGALALLGAVVKGCAPHGASKESYRRATVGREDIRITKTATGEVTPQNRVEVKPPIAGRIEEVLVHEGDAVKQGDVLARMSSTDRAALLDAARSQGPEAVARWEQAYKVAPLMSPLDGSVIVRAVEPGQTVTTADPVVVVADRLIVKAQVDETDIGSIQVGQGAVISLDAYPDVAIPARVDHVAYEAKTVNNVTIYEVDVLPEQIPDYMRSGMTATVTFITMEKPGALVVPTEAVRQSPSGEEVLTPGPSAWAKPVAARVTIGLSDGKRTEIVSGLREGDALLVPSLRMPHNGHGPRGSPLSPFSRRPSSGDRSRPRQ